MFLIKNTNVNSVPGHSVEANIEADMRDRVSVSPPFLLVDGGVPPMVGS